MQNKIKFGELLFFIMGVFSTTPILEVCVGGRSITLFSITFLATLILLWVRNKQFFSTPIFTNPVCYFFLWMMTGIVASCVGWSYFNGNEIWQSAAIAYLPKMILYIAFAILWEQEASERENLFLLKGLLFGAIFNCTWAALDGVCFYVAGFSLNNAVFSSYIQRHGVRFGQLSLILANGMLRAAGFNMDPANIGFLGPIVIAYGLHKRHYGVAVVGFLSLVFSASTTAAVVLLAIFLLEWKNLIPKRKKNSGGTRIWMYLLGVLGIAVGTVIVIRVIPLVARAISMFAERINGAYIHTDESSPRTVYYLGFFKALLTEGPIVFTGSGFGTSSFPYIKNVELFRELKPYIDNAPYDPEMTYIAYLFDCGIFGLLLYLHCLFLLYRYYKENLYTLEYAAGCYYMLLSTVFSALFYHYILFAPQILLIVAGLVEIGHSQRKSKMGNRNNTSLERFENR